MAIAIINEFDNKIFQLNGIGYVRNFVAIKIGESIRITSAYDSRFTLVVAHYSEYLINNISYNSAESVVSILSPLLFVKDELLMTADGEATNSTIAAIFTNVNGNWVNTPTTPGSGDILLDLTNAKNGAVCVIYYTGNTITKDIFIGGTIVFLNGSNNINELSLVFIIFDKGSNSFSVNIQKGATGDIPVPPTGDLTPPNKLITLNVISGSSDSIAPNKLIILNTINTDGIPPNKLITINIT